MAELQKFMQASNGAFKSDLVKSYVASHRGDFPQAPAAPGFNHNNTGAGLFPSTNTSTTNTSTTGVDTTDNANIIMQGNRTDNIALTAPDNITTKTSTTTPGNNTTTTTSTTTSSTTSSPLILEDNGNNGNLNANVNANRQTSVAAPETPDSNANVSEVRAVVAEVRGEMTEGLQLLVQQVTTATEDAHMATCANTHKAVSEATARFLAAKEAGQLPDLSKLSLSAGSMWEKMMDQMMPELGKTMQFCKMLPAFSELCLDDQMKLIKQGMFEVMMTRFSMLIDHEKETMMDPSHKMICPRKVIEEMPMGKFLGGFFHVGAQFNPLGLTDGEIGLFTAVLVFDPCRAGLTDTKLVASVQSLYHRALFALLKQNHSDPEAKLSQALGLVPMFRRINAEHSKALQAMKMQSPDACDKQFPPIHSELFTKVAPRE